MTFAQDYFDWASGQR
ncbi:hypothetical protein BN440_pEA290004 (plasmid) [Erwinia amylovora MR1]|nr:hypothetical protein BN440_pEA290004 [Erwinia amylovora MR1]